MGDIWLSEYENVIKMLNQVSQEVKEFEIQQRANPAHGKTAAGGVRRSLVNLTNELSRLMDSLTYGNLRINERESLRRRQMVEGLITRKNNLSTTFEAAANNSNLKNELLGDSSGRRQWGKPKETEQTKQMTNQQIFQQNDMIMKEQDESLDVLSHSLLRTKNMALTMNNELDLHNKLLDDVEIGVERTTSRISNTNKKMETLSKNAGSTCMIVIIVLLILFIIALLATDSGCKIYNDPKHCP